MKISISSLFLWIPNSYISYLWDFEQNKIQNVGAYTDTIGTTKLKLTFYI